MALKEYFDSIKNKSVCVIGMGISNIPLIRLLHQYNIKTRVCEMRSREALLSEGVEMFDEIDYFCGNDYLEHIEGDIVFRTPGVMPFEEHIVRAKERGAVITSEIEVMCSLCPSTIIAVTGSDGKTTTSTIIHHLLSHHGEKVFLGGNIGTPLLDKADEMQPGDFVVLELSSFQLHSMYINPKVAVITNIAPNHLDKHIDYNDYIQSKKAVYLNQNPAGKLVLYGEDELTPEIEKESKAPVWIFSLEKIPEKGCFAKDNIIYSVNNGEISELAKVSDILIPGVHNLKNYLTAYCAVSDYITPEDFFETARTFTGVEHRLETFCVLNNIKFINDSIATSPTRTIAGIMSMPQKPIIILGGYDKKLPFDELGNVVAQNVKKVYVTGDTAPKIKEAIESSTFYTTDLPVIHIDDFTECVRQAALNAEPGDIMLFSPSCAAFDRFKNFVQRGKYFKNIILELKNEL